MAQVRVCLIVIGGEKFSKLEVVFLFFVVATRLFLQNNEYQLHQKAFLSVFVPQMEYETRESNVAFFTVVETRIFG